MKYHILAFGAGFLLDQLFGDPYFLPHPIRGIGWLIAKTEKTLRAGNPQGNSTEREGAERRQGKLLVVIVLLFTGMLSALISFGAYAMHPGLGVVIEAVMTYQILAARCLQMESSKAVSYTHLIVNGEVRGNLSARDYFAHKTELIPEIKAAIPIFTMSFCFRLISAGLPAPSMTIISA